MKDISQHSFETRFSLKPLLNFWQHQLAANCEHMRSMNNNILKRLEEHPELTEDIGNPEIISQHEDILRPLMSVIFAPATWETDIKAILEPFSLLPVYATPLFKELLMESSGRIKGSRLYENAFHSRGKILRSYLHILNRIYGITQDYYVSAVRKVADNKTGLDRFYRFSPSLQFVDVATKGKPVYLDEQTRTQIIDNWNNLDFLQKVLDPQKFVLTGFTVLTAVDCTVTETINRMERMLIRRNASLTGSAFYNLRDRMRTLFGKPELKLGLAGIKNKEILLLNPRDDEEKCELDQSICLFKDSNRVPMEKFENSIYAKAMEENRLLRIDDLLALPVITDSERALRDTGIRSVMISPLLSEGEPIGCLELYSEKPNEFGPMDAILMERVTPVCSMAVKMALDKIDYEVQALVKEKATAVHPSVEWRFVDAASRHLERKHLGLPSEMEPLVFRDVYPLYGSSDIRGSATFRNIAIQKDLTKHLSLSQKIITGALRHKNWPLLHELSFGISNHLERIAKGLSTGDEVAVTGFIQREIEPVFKELGSLGPNVLRAIEIYQKSLDFDMGTIYEERKEFEDAVSKLNKGISTYLDHEEKVAQGFFPHYFEKHQTDGVDYVIYIGNSMTEGGGFVDFFAQNLRLWQLMTACSIAWLTEQYKNESAIKLDTCHLILVNHNPLSVRFRYDEKRFDVDGAYDVRQEIIMSRLDKAVLKDTGERLTQPGQIAIVYSSPSELREMKRHVAFLQARGFLGSNLDVLVLEDLPGVKGLRALRIDVDLKSSAMEERLTKLALVV